MSRSFDGDGANRLSGTGVATGFDVPLTIGAHFYPDVAAAGTVQVIATVGNIGANHRYLLNLNASDQVVAQSFTTTGAVALTSAAVTHNAWNVGMAVIASDTDRRAYLNGGNKGTNGNSRNVAAVSDIVIGCATGFNNPFTGLIACVAIWLDALDDNEALMFGRGVPPWAIRPASLARVYMLDAVASPEPNVWPGNYALTVTGTVPNGASNPPIALPFPWMRPASEIISVASSSILAGLATETDSALAVGRMKDMAVGIASEADSAFAASFSRQIQAGLAIEADSALAAVALREYLAGLAGETDEALAAAAVRSLTAGLATETDIALAALAHQTLLPDAQPPWRSFKRPDSRSSMQTEYQPRSFKRPGRGGSDQSRE